MTEVRFTRKGNIIKNLDGTIEYIGTYTETWRGSKNKYPSINAAKYRSRELQEKYGKGCVKVIKY